jgi:hypothetical protein
MAMMVIVRGTRRRGLRVLAIMGSLALAMVISTSSVVATHTLGTLDCGAAAPSRSTA